ncbi:MAG: aminotransferase class IV, partial [Chloroflexi bacterium]|nr:aminotransferase class IV [Chloroflexota bacterium]
YDEAILLNQDGHVSEGSGENIFMIGNGRLFTPPSADNILVGITRATVIELAQKELGLDVVETTIDRSELYVADECFMTGTAAHITPVVELDQRPIGTGKMGPVAKELVKLYFDVITGRNAKYAHWCTPCYSRVKA